MDTTARHAGTLVAAALITTVITQIVYVVTLSEVGMIEGWPLRSTLWTIEFFAFTLMAVAAFSAASRNAERSLLWSALGVSALFNVVQTGFGLSMFLPLAQAGDDFAPVLGTVVGGAFVFYFLAKVLIGLAGAGFGLALIRGNGGIRKAFGALAILAGVAAVAVNIFAIPQGMAHVFPAGAAGTVATLLTGIVVWLFSRQDK